MTTTLDEAITAYPTTTDAVLTCGLIIIQGVTEGVISPDDPKHGAALHSGMKATVTTIESLPAEVQEEIRQNPEATALLNCNRILVDFGDATHPERLTPLLFLDFLGRLGARLSPEGQ